MVGEKVSERRPRLHELNRPVQGLSDPKWRRKLLESLETDS